MTHDDFIDIERAAARAMRAISNWANPEDRKLLGRAEYMLAEMRFAAEWLCNPQASAEDKAMATQRLTEVFTNKLN